MSSSTSSSVVSGEELKANLIGQRLKIKIIGETVPVEADIFAVDNAAQTVVLRRQKTHTWQKADYFMVPFQSIEQIEFLGDGDSIPPVRDFTLSEIQSRYSNGARREEARLATRGKGVSETAQKIFDFLHPNFPGSRWQDKSIIIAEAILISPPYNVANVKTVVSTNVTPQMIDRLTESLRRARESLGLSDSDDNNIPSADKPNDDNTV